MALPTIPDDDADFTPAIARKIVAAYQELLSRQRSALQGARVGLVGAGFVGPSGNGSGDSEINAIDDALRTLG